MSKDENQQKHWDPTSLFENSKDSNEVAVILLNQPITDQHKSTIRKIWCQATLRLCADGGANRLYEAYKDDIALPHEIRGDLDSIRDEVKAFYAGKGVRIVKAASQYATDLQKCILRVEETEEAKVKESGKDTIERMDIVIIGGLSGRFDQTMHTLHVLCQVAPVEKGIESYERVEPIRRKNKGLDENDFVSLDRREKTWVLSENSLVWILTKGSHLITIDLSCFGPTCGLLPFASQLQAEPPNGTRIWTKGLEWDLGECKERSRLDPRADGRQVDGTPSAVGSFLSTSNHLKEALAEIKAEKEILWTMEIREATS